MRRPTEVAFLVLILVLGASYARAVTADDDLSIHIVPGGTAESPVIEFEELFGIVLSGFTAGGFREFFWFPQI